MNRKTKHLAVLLFGLLLINVFNQNFYKRFDLTQDQRYTLSDVTKTILEKVKSRMFIHVYLEGEFPSEFKRLQIETRQYLEELKAQNSQLKIRFIHPDGKRDQLIQSGMYPSQLTVQENGKLLQCHYFSLGRIYLRKKT